MVSWRLQLQHEYHWNALHNFHPLAKTNSCLHIKARSHIINKRELISRALPPIFQWINDCKWVDIHRFGPFVTDATPNRRTNHPVKNPSTLWYATAVQQCYHPSKPAIAAKQWVFQQSSHPRPDVQRPRVTVSSGLTLIWSFMTSPQAGAPTRPVPTFLSSLSIEPTLRGFS